MCEQCQAHDDDDDIEALARAFMARRHAGQGARVERPADAGRQGAAERQAEARR